MKTTCLKILAAVLGSLLYTGTAFGQAAVPFIFTPGTPARAAEVNSNFQVHTGAINANSAGIGANSAAIFANNFLRVVLVKPAIGNALASGTALLDALAAITDASNTNFYQILLEPGLYDMGGSPLVMKPWVTIRGFGNSSVILSSVDSPVSGTVVGANNSGLISVNIQNTGGGANAIALYYDAVTSGGLGNVKVQASGSASNVGVGLDNGSDLNFSHLEARALGGSNTFGLLLQAASKVRVSDSVIVAGFPISGTTTNSAVFNNSSTVVIVNSEISAFGPGNRGIINIGAPAAPVEIHRSSIRAPGGFSLDAPAGFTVKVAVSLLEGPTLGAGTFTCASAYNPSFTVITGPC